MNRLTALILCAVMLLSLCACGGTPAQTTVPPTTTAPPPAASELYAEAAAKLAARENVELELTYIEEMTMGADTFKTSTQGTVTLLGIGTEAFAAQVSEEYYSGDLRVYTDEVYQGGTMYTEMNNVNFKAAMTTEEYLKRYVPAVLVDETLYETVELAGKEFTFTGATALENWCDNPFADLKEATATAKLGDDGEISQFTYKASFIQGAADMALSVTVKIKTPELTEVALPAKAEHFTELDTPEAPALMMLVTGYLDQATAVLSSTTDVITSQAAGFVETKSSTMAAHGKDATQIASWNTVYQFVDGANGTTEGYTLVETYHDGILTTVEDGGEPETTEGLTGYDMQAYVDADMYYMLPDMSTITDYDLTVIGDTALLSYTCSDASAKEYEDYYCEHYFGDPELLSNLASASTVNEHGGSIGIDLVTGMPLSLSETFSMTHTIDGADYVLSAQYNKSIELGAKDAYETITGEELPAEEPAEKPQPVFYKVTGANGEQMWLLGTIHVGDERTTYLPQEIYDAFAASDALAVEFESESYETSLMEDEEAIQAYIQALLYTDGTTLKDHLKDEELYEKAIKLLKATGNYSHEAAVELTKPVFHYLTLSNYFMDCGYRLSGEYGVDGQLEQLAKEQEKEILSVESGEFQMDLLGNLSEELQEFLLKETVESGKFAYYHGTHELFEMWCRGDEAELVAYLNEEDDDSGMTDEEKALYEEYETALGGERNVDMLAVAQEYLNSGKTVFYAVGLAHLLTEDGLVNTLRNAGYTVELVSYAG